MGALQSMKLDSEMRDNNIEVAPPPAIQRIAGAKPRFNLHRARTMEEYTTEVGSTQSEAKPRCTPHWARTKEDDTTEAEPRVRPATKKRRAPPSQEALQNMILGSDVREHHRGGSTPSNTENSRSQSPF